MVYNGTLDEALGVEDEFPTNVVSKVVETNEEVEPSGEGIDDVELTILEIEIVDDGTSSVVCSGVVLLKVNELKHPPVESTSKHAFEVKDVVE